MSQKHLHSNNFDICRICMLEPEANRNVKFTRIFPRGKTEDFTLQRQIEEIFGIKVEKDGIKPKIICENCHNSLSRWVELKKKAAESTIVVNYVKRSKIARRTTSSASPYSLQNLNNEEQSTSIEQERNETNTLRIKTRLAKKKFEYKTENMQEIPLPSTNKLFTCLKPACKSIFQSFAAFKLHHRRHFGYGSKIICWLCCAPFSNVKELRYHKMNDNCCTPGKFKCYECSDKFDDLEGFSIHKLTFHNGNLVTRKNNKNTIKCRFCQKEIYIDAFKDHLDKFH